MSAALVALVAAVTEVAFARAMLGWREGIVALGCALLVACGGYRAGDLRLGDGNAERSASCLDLRVTPHTDPEVSRRGWMAVRYELGNACRSAVPIDLGRARIIRLADGRVMPPRGADSVRPALLDAGARGGEVLAYDAEPGTVDYCVELAGVAPGTEALAPVCFTHVDPFGPAKIAMEGKTR